MPPAHRPAVAVVLGLLVLTTGLRTSAQEPRPVDLQSIKALKCIFAITSRGTWSKEGVPQPQIRKSGVLTVEITEINVSAGSAMVGTTSGNHDVTAQIVEGKALYFLEVNRGGRLAITTVLSEYSSGAKLKASYSRHDYLPIDLGTIFKSEPEVAGYYGDCEVTR